MQKNDKIYIAGHNGLVGSAILRNLQHKGYQNIMFASHAQCDLTDQASVAGFFAVHKPDYVFLAAARVGGIEANFTYRAQFIFENLQIQNNIIHQSYLHKVKKLLFLGSSCIYPHTCPQPMQEDMLLTAPLEYTNEPYAVAKIAGMKMCEAYNLQYGTNFVAVMPTNLYGPNDNFDLEKSHVLPALIRKMYLAKCLQGNDYEAIADDLNRRPVEGIDGNAPLAVQLRILEKYGLTTENHTVCLTLWGSGKPRREFLHADDLADACVFVMEKVDFRDILYQECGITDLSLPIKDRRAINTHLNIGTGTDLSIDQLAQTIKRITGFTGLLRWDTSKPDGTFQKLLDTARINRRGWSYSIPLEQGIESVYQLYTNNST